LIKAPDTVKEKAMLKLKEVKAKSEDSGTKARQYLDGLLKIPFGIYKKEPILNIIKTMKDEFIELSKKYDFTKLSTEFLPKENYTNLEIYNCLLQSVKLRETNKIPIIIFCFISIIFLVKI
jgi:ATP-dependent Lon protease